MSSVGHAVGERCALSSAPNETLSDQECGYSAVFGEPTLGDAILDRIVHNAYRLDLDGPSMRKVKADQASEPAPATDTKSIRESQKIISPPRLPA